MAIVDGVFVPDATPDYSDLGGVNSLAGMQAQTSFNASEDAQYNSTAAGQTYQAGQDADYFKAIANGSNNQSDSGFFSSGPAHDIGEAALVVGATAATGGLDLGAAGAGDAAAGGAAASEAGAAAASDAAATDAAVGASSAAASSSGSYLGVNADLATDYTANGVGSAGVTAADSTDATVYGQGYLGVVPGSPTAYADAGVGSPSLLGGVASPASAAASAGNPFLTSAGTALGTAAIGAAVNAINPRTGQPAGTQVVGRSGGNQFVPGGTQAGSGGGSSASSISKYLLPLAAVGLVIFLIKHKRMRA